MSDGIQGEMVYTIIREWIKEAREKLVIYYVREGSE